MNRSVRRRLSALAGSVGISLALFLVATAALNSMPPPPTPVVPVEVVASGLGTPIGIAVSPSGAIVVSDRRAGTVTLLGPGGTHVVLADGLQRPVGLAFEPDGRLLIVEERAGRLLERQPSGSIATRATGLSVPRWVAVAQDGSAYVTGDGPGGDDDDDDPGASGGMRVMRVSPAGAVSVAGQGFIGLQGLALGPQGLAISMRRLSTETAGDWTRLAVLPFTSPGSFGPAVRMLSENMAVPSAVAVDHLGAVYLTAAPSRGVDGDDNDNGDTDSEQDGVLLKRLPTGELVTLATGLAAPHGIAIEADGHVLVVEQRRGRALRLRAPAAPTINSPAFTNQSPAMVTGTAEPGSRVHVFRDGNYGAALGSATADAATGAFSLSVTLTANAANDLTFIATSSGGHGLTSGPLGRTIVHDDVLPTTAMLAPPADVHTNGLLAVTARGEDGGSGVARISVAIDGQPNGDIANGDPTEPLVANFGLNTPTLAEGPHTLTATTRDRAGNESFAGQTFVVDRTPPETQIVSGPGATTGETSVTFTVAGTDVISGSDALVFSWRLDEGAWSGFGPNAPVALSGLTPGSHRFEVKARDVAGNEDPSPAARTFQVVTGLRIQIAEPTAGTVLLTDTLLVRGTVTGGADDVTVVVPLPVELRGVLDAAEWPASVEAGTFALQLPIAPGMTEVVVIATDSAGNSVREQVAVSVAQVPVFQGESRLRVSPPVGFAPHVVGFGVGQSVGSRIALDVEGDGTFDYEGPDLQDRTFTYALPGIYSPAIRETTPEGIVFTARAIVQVYDRASLDARLQASWQGFKQALQAGNVTLALGYIHSGRRINWVAPFNQLTPAQLATVDTVFTNIELVEVRGGVASCDMRREEDGQMLSFPIEFALDTDGRWRLWQF